MKRTGREDDPALAKWCQCAVTYIRDKRDRREVYEELYGHMEDRLEDLMASGLSRSDAQTLTVRAMGDFNETGRELAKLYKPFWGRMLAAARAVFIVTAVLTAVAALGSWGRIFSVGTRQDGRPWDTTSEEDIVRPDCRDESDGYVITVPRAAINDGGVYFTVNFKKPWPWTKEPRVEAFYAVDSEGERYEIPMYDRGVPERYLALSRDENVYSGALTTSFEGRIVGFEDAEWFELRYDRDGRDVRLRVETGR